MTLISCPLHIWLQSHLCLPLEHVGRGSTPDPDLSCNFQGSTSSPAPSHLCLTLNYVGWSFWVPTILCYLQNGTFHPIFLLLILILFALFYICHISYFSSAILIALNDNLELTVYVDLETSSELNWYVYLLTIFGQFHFLLLTLFFF